mmetsp:Transcript_4743/g.10188  ORF Transcript_4743/g.10188 Transcript_4743/m.10188 type:complete len:216 (+) Transcript_4743:1307-1954(+)
MQVARVGEVVHPLLAAEARLRLGQLVVVVRKLQILAPRVDVDPFPQNVPGDDGALDVPSRTAGPEGRLPRRLACLARLPEREVVGAALFAGSAVGQCALPLGHLGRRGRGPARPCRIELAIVVTRRLQGIQVEVHRSVAFVRHAFRDDLLHEGDDLGHVLGDARQDVRLANAERFHVFHELAFVLSCVRVEHRVISDQVALLPVQLLREDGFGGN